MYLSFSVVIVYSGDLLCSFAAWECFPAPGRGCIGHLSPSPLRCLLGFSVLFVLGAWVYEALQVLKLSVRAKVKSSVLYALLCFNYYYYFEYYFLSVQVLCENEMSILKSTLFSFQMCQWITVLPPKHP